MRLSRRFFARGEKESPNSLNLPRANRIASKIQALMERVADCGACLSNHLVATR
jgi:hypothetical protein